MGKPVVVQYAEAKVANRFTGSAALVVDMANRNTTDPIPRMEIVGTPQRSWLSLKSPILATTCQKLLICKSLKSPRKDLNLKQLHFGLTTNKRMTMESPGHIVKPVVVQYAEAKVANRFTGSAALVVDMANRNTTDPIPRMGIVGTLQLQRSWQMQMRKIILGLDPNSCSGKCKVPLWV